MIYVEEAVDEAADLGLVLVGAIAVDQHEREHRAHGQTKDCVGVGGTLEERAVLDGWREC